MPGFNQLARLVNLCKRGFYALFRGLLRKKQSKGHGIHSPFAFDLITNVIYSPYSYYAFSDIREIVSQNGIDPDSITGFNHLSFRLVHHFQSKNILEINSGNGINSLFLTAASPDIRCRCLETDSGKIAVAERLRRKARRKWEMTTTLSQYEGERYDAIVINLQGGAVPDIQTLIGLSHSDTFWLLHPVKKGTNKQFWNEIVHDMRGGITFDLKDTGIVFLRPDLYKVNYFV